jgi:tetratricopeptide (TPR) repeat protein
MDWRQLLGMDQAKIEDLRYVGYTYLKEGHYKIAIRFFEALTILEPKNAYDYRTLGALYLQTGQLQYALNYLERALRMDPKHELTKLNKLKTLYLLGYYKQANSLADDLIKSSSLQVKNKAESLFLAYS